MPLVPVNFAVPNSTTLKILFNASLSDSISKDNIEISALEGGIENLVVKDVEVKDSVLIITTSIQQSDGFYLLRMKDSSSKFKSSNGMELTTSKQRREIYFSGFKKLNPVRDRILNKVPGSYNKGNSNISRILDVHSEEIYEAQKSVGQLLNDNYIRVEVEDEIRIRTSSAKDYIANENCFKIKRVSKSPKASNISNNIINIGTLGYREKDENQVISLQEVFKKTTLKYSDLSLALNGNILNLDNDNVIKVLSVKFFREAPEVDCNGNFIYFEYPIENLKYGLSNSFYDKDFSYKRFDIDSNQIFLNNFEYIILDTDYIEVEYLYKDKSVYPDIGSLKVSYVDKKNFEAIPLSLNYFNLSNTNISLADGSSPAKGGLKFFSDFSNVDKKYFTNEIHKDSSSFPKFKGEYKVNYNDGIVYLFGDNGNGIEEDIILCSYNFLKVLNLNSDYYINEDFDLFINYYSINDSENVEISYEYSSMFVEGIHYKDCTNKESINESVGSNFVDFFKLKTKNFPITEIFRITNRTTGEIYQPVSTFNNEVLFSGSKSPQFINEEKESINFLKISNEKLFVSNKSFSSILYGKISNIDGNKVYFDNVTNKYSNDLNYFLRSSNYTNEYSVVSFIFSNEDIIGAVLSDNGFVVGQEFFLGFMISEIGLKNKNILSRNSSNGNFLNSSLMLDKKIFKKEIHSESSYDIKNFGEYKVDYANGIIFCAINDYDPGSCEYRVSKFTTKNPRVLSVNDIFYDSGADINLENIEVSNSTITIKSMPDSIEVYSGDSVYDKLKATHQEALVVRSDKTILTRNSYYGINYLDKMVNFPNSTSNLFDPNKHSYFENTIDLKVYSKSKINLSNFLLQTKTESDKIFEIKSTKDGSVLFKDGFLNKFSFIPRSHSYASGSTKVYVSSSEISNISVGDLMNVSGDRFEVTSVNPISNYFLVSGQVNDIVSASIVEEATEISLNGKMAVEIPTSMVTFVDMDAVYEISYFEADGISIGDKVFVEFKTSNIYCGYTYIKDDIYISYQYGDNSIDWSISDNALLVGDTYYVDYEFGALRSQLKKNFGVMTEIPFFNNFELDVDREFYRDALQGTLQSFSKGPVMDSYYSLVDSITGTRPIIEESFYRGWILGFDNLSSNSINYSDDLTFKTCKYKEGVYFGDKSFVSVSTDNVLSASEGSVSLWATNEWSGITNDADINLEFYDVGTRLYDYKKDLKIRVGSSSRVYLEDSKFSILNFLDLSRDEVLAKKSIESLTPGCELITSFDISISDSKDYGFSEKSVASIIVNDGYKNIGLDVKTRFFEDTSGSPISFVIGSLDYNSAPSLSNKIPVVECKCTYPSSKSIFNFIESVVQINFSSNISVEASIDESYLYSEKAFYLKDSSESIFKILKFVDEYGNYVPTSWNGNISGIIVDRKPTMSTGSITQMFAPKDILIPSDGFQILYGAIEVFKDKSKSESILGSKSGICIDIFKKRNISIAINSNENRVEIKSGNNKIKYFYSDFYIDGDYSLAKGLSYFLSSNISSDKGISFFCNNLDLNLKVDLTKFRYSIKNIFSEKDIYIGSDSKSPSSWSFSISDEGDKFGIPGSLSYVDSGIFIYKEHSLGEEYFKDCDNIWSILVKPILDIKVPYDAVSETEFLFEDFRVEQKVSGKIKSNSSFYRAGYSKKLGQELSEDKKIELSYSNGSIISDGWNAKSRAFSDVINIELDGVNINSYDWFSTNGLVDVDGLFSLSGNSDYSISTKTASYEGIIYFSMKSNVSLDLNNLILNISSNSNSKYTGIKPILIELEGLTISSEYIVYNGKQSIIFSNESDGSNIGLIAHDWNGNDTDIKVEIDKTTGYIYFYINGQIKASSSISVNKTNSIVGLKSVLRTKGYYSGVYTVNIESMDYISESFAELLESRDSLTISDNEIEFEFFGTENYDGYGYEEEYNKLLFVSEKEKYLIDSSSEDSSISIYKDSYGYLNFKILDHEKTFKISYDIKDLEFSSTNHFAASWAINETENKMSLFLNGKEVPNVYSLGSGIPVFSYEKLGDISKEKLQDDYFSKIKFYDEMKINTIAGQNYATSSDIGVEHIGRAVDIIRTEIYDDLIGSYLYISNVENGNVYFKNGITKEDFVFSGSSEVFLKLAPTIGLETDLVTDIGIKNFKVFINNSVATSNIDSTTEFKFINNDGKFIEFFGINNLCKYSSSITEIDEVHIRNYGISSYYVDKLVDVTGLTEDMTFLSKYNFIMTKITTNLPAPKNYGSVKLYKVFEENLVPENYVYTNNSKFYSNINHIFSSNQNKYKSSDYLEEKTGFELEIDLFSPNINFNGYRFDLTINGNEGATSEIISVSKNGKYYTSNKFFSIESIVAAPEIIDQDEEPISISIRQRQNILSSGLKIFKYSEGDFIIGKDEDEYSSYSITNGSYRFGYSSSLDIDSGKFGERLTIGNSQNIENPWKGTIEEFKIYNRFKDESGAFYEYSLSRPICPNKETSCLISLNDPSHSQREALRKETFLGSDNFKFSLSDYEMTELMPYLNNKVEFTRRLSSIGISSDIAEKTFFRVHKAGGGPILDISNYNPDGNNIGNRPGPNENFSGSMLLKHKGLSVDSSKKIIENREFSISTWISPLFDSESSSRDRFIFSASNVKSAVIKESGGSLVLPERAYSIERIEAVTIKDGVVLEDDKLYDKYNIYGNTGSKNDFSTSSKILDDKRTIILENKIYKPNSYYRVYFSPDLFSRQSIALYLDKDSNLVLDIKSKDKAVSISEELYFDYLKWYKILITYKDGEFKVFVNGKKVIQHFDRMINFNSYFGNINFLSDEHNDRIFSGKVSSTKISRKANGYYTDGLQEKDINYSDKYDNNREMVADEYTTYLNNFNFSLSRKDSYAEVIDKKSGIFDFEIDILDPFDKLNKDYKKDLVEYLIKRVKPAHSNAIVRIKKDRC